MIFRPLYVDILTHQLAPVLYANTQAAGVAAAQAIYNINNSGMANIRMTTVIPQEGLARSAPYQSVYDVCELVFTSGAPRSRVRVLVPAPPQSLFLPDQETYDAAGHVTFTNTLLDNLTDPNGRPLVALISGQRRRLTPAR